MTSDWLPIFTAPNARVFVTGGSGFIGTNLVESMKMSGVPVLNLDIRPPLDPRQHASWIRGDIRDYSVLRSAFLDFQPTHIVHLAARTDLGGETPQDYSVNSMGTQILIRAMSAMSRLKAVVFASTQFVCQPGFMPSSDDHYCPHTLYGESKVEMERLVRQSDIPSTWTIVRPTTIWGPWDLGYRSAFYWTMSRGLYLHPAGVQSRRSLGFVGNTLHQIYQVLNSRSDIVNGKTLYIGDALIETIDWVNEFSIRIRGKCVKAVPSPVVSLAARVGDFLSSLDITFPINSRRYRTMSEDYLVPLEKTWELIGHPPIPMSDGVEITVKWLVSNGVVST